MFAKMAGRSLFSLSMVGLVGVGLSACTNVGGMTYGTGETQEAALIKDVSGLIGDSEKKAPIDYSARPGLVLPPDGSNLPTPVDGRGQAASVATNWPQDPDELRRIYQEKLATMTDKDRQSLLAAIRALPKEQRDAIIKNDPRATAFANQIEEHDYSKGPATAGQNKRYSEQVKARLALINAANGKNQDPNKRVYLTQPPESFRELTPEVQQELAKAQTEPEKKKGKSFFGKLWPF